MQQKVEAELCYTSVEVTQKPVDVFWEAIALARWTGLATIQYAQLSFQYETKSARMVHDVAVVCSGTPGGLLRNPIGRRCETHGGVRVAVIS